MTKIWLTVEARAPLAIGRRKPGGSVNETENYIPGAVIRGAIAGHLLQISGQQGQDLSANTEDNDFAKLFLGESPAVFSNGYPAIAADVGTATVMTEPVWVLPATALSSKSKDGFLPKGNGVFDTLIDRFCAESVGHLYDPTCPVEAGGRVEPYGGFYCHQADKYYRPAISTRLLTRVGINRRRATAQDSLLYSIQVLNETQGRQPNNEPQPARYTGSIWVQQGGKLVEDLAEFLNGRQLRMGGAASRGLGKVKLTAQLAADATEALTVEQRVQKFNGALFCTAEAAKSENTHKGRLQLWYKLFGKEDEMPERLSKRTFFTLDLQSDGIFRDRWRRTTVVSPAMLQGFAAVEDDTLALETAYSSYSYSSGWNAAWGLMKDIELVTNKGAVYLFSTEKPDLWLPALAELENLGIGDRAAEGFGQVRICNEFHTIFREGAV